MALISVDELNEYTGNYETASYKATLIGAASDVVESYLGYSLAKTNRSHEIISWGTDRVILPVPNVASITSIYIGDTLLASTDYTLVAGRLFSQVVFTETVLRGQIIKIAYIAGYDVVPDVIKQAALRIAALMLEEANGNIGVTSKTFADMSRQFVSYTNYNKYLYPISGYRLGAL